MRFERWAHKHAVLLLLALSACHSSSPPSPSATPPRTPSDATSGPALPLTLVADVDLPGRAVRFDYQALDLANQRLVIAHMNDASVVVVDLGGGQPIRVIPSIPMARGVVVAGEVGRIFVTSAPDQLVILDSGTLTEVARVLTGRAPDGVSWDPTQRMVAVSDQGDGALSLIADSGLGARRQLPLGSETGNVTFDGGRGWFWITVAAESPPDRLVAVDPTKVQIVQSIELPGCSGAHGLAIHPDGKSAFVACEANDTLVRVELDGAHSIATVQTGSGPDVLSVDPGLGWLYVAAESGDLTVVDITRPGVVLVGRDHPADRAHSVAVDPASHRSFFPLAAGPSGTPVLRIMRPGGAGGYQHSTEAL